jgi:hypothetical protein
MFFNYLRIQLSITTIFFYFYSLLSFKHTTYQVFTFEFMFGEGKPPQLPREFESRQNGVLNRSQFFSPFMGFYIEVVFVLKTKITLISENKRFHQEITLTRDIDRFQLFFSSCFCRRKLKTENEPPK